MFFWQIYKIMIWKKTSFVKKCEKTSIDKINKILNCFYLPSKTLNLNMNWLFKSFYLEINNFQTFGERAQEREKVTEENEESKKAVKK